MTRKDYVLIAEALRAVRPRAGDANATADVVQWMGRLDQWSDVALSVAEALARDNERFDRLRFLEACN